MVSKQTATIIVAIIGLLGAVGGGSLIIDQSSTTTTTDNSQTTTTTIIEGDTIINEAVSSFTDELFDDFIDYAYDEYCEEINPDSEECDWYWED